MQQERIPDRRFSGIAIFFLQMDGQKMDWIRKQLGMTKVQFHHELGISRMHLFRCLRDGPPKLVKMAVLGLWYSRKMGDILEAPEPTVQAQTPAKRRQRKGYRKTPPRRKKIIFSLYYVSLWYLLRCMEGLPLKTFAMLAVVAEYIKSASRRC